MAVLTAKQRHGLEPSQFALSGGRFPIPDASHGRNALARAHFASPAEQATIKRKVHAKFPAIEVGGKPTKKFADGGPVTTTASPILDKVRGALDTVITPVLDHIEQTSRTPGEPLTDAQKAWDAKMQARKQPAKKE